MKGRNTISEADNLGTTHYQRSDTKPCISHERSKIDMGKNTWAPKLIKDTMRNTSTNMSL